MRTRNKMATLVALVSLLGLVLVNVGGASGLHDGDNDILRLHLDTDGNYFAHDGASEPKNLKQDLTASQCLVDDESKDGPLVSLSANNVKVGVSFDSLGVRSKGPGRSCGRVDGSESLTISINNDSDDPATTTVDEKDALEGLNFYSMKLDIEAKQNVVVVAKTYFGGISGSLVGTFRLQTGDSATGEPDETPHEATSGPAAPDADCLQGVSDSGSDNGANDNCRWTIEPGIPFDTVVFTTPEGGEFGLEGGADTPFDSLFYLTDVGVLDCGDTVTTDDLGDPEVSVTRQLQSDCQLKEFLLASSSTTGPNLPVAGSQSFTFDPAGGGVGQANATFDLTVTWVPEAPQNPVPPTQMDFNGDGDLDEPLEGDLVWCEGTTANPVLPSTGEPWCLVEQHTTLVGVGMMQVVERLFGTEDPNGWR